VLRPSTFVPPCEPIQRDRPPKGDSWLHEVKFDGYRMQIHKAGRKLWLFTRRGHDWTDRFPRLVAELAALPTCIIDAELVATDAAGLTDFATLQRAVSRRQEGGLAWFAFDLLYAGARDIRGVPYIERKARLAGLLARTNIGVLRHSEFLTDGNRLLTECGKRGLEGIVSKRRDSAYRSGKLASWVKVKCQAWREANRERHLLASPPSSPIPLGGMWLRPAPRLALTAARASKRPRDREQRRQQVEAVAGGEGVRVDPHVMRTDITAQPDGPASRRRPSG
jgi:ATP-dependent DNA ligase